MEPAGKVRTGDLDPETDPLPLSGCPGNHLQSVCLSVCLQLDASSRAEGNFRYGNAGFEVAEQIWVTLGAAEAAEDRSWICAEALNKSQMQQPSEGGTNGSSRRRNPESDEWI